MSAANQSSAARRRALKRSMAASEKPSGRRRKYASENRSRPELEASGNAAWEQFGKTVKSRRPRGTRQTVALEKATGWNSRWRAWRFRWHGQPSLVFESRFASEAASSGSPVSWLRAQAIRSPQTRPLGDARRGSPVAMALLDAKPPRTAQQVACARRRELGMRFRNARPRERNLSGWNDQKVSGRRDTIIRIAAAPARS